jgi:hypothetical protein
MKKTAQKVIIAIGILIFAYWTYIGFKYPFWKDYTITRCGVVEQLLEGDRTNKSHNIRELYLGVKFDSGEFEAVNVDPTTYMQKNVGDKICFNQRDDSNSLGQFMSMIYWSIIGCILIITSLVLVVIVFEED